MLFRSVTFERAVTDTRWADALAALVADGRVRHVEVRKVDGVPVATGGPWASALRGAGFEEGYRGWVCRT